MGEQARQLARVAPALAPTVLRFCREREARGERRFRGPELAAFVREHCPNADGSPTRILRMLRDTGQLRVECVDRSSSTYEIKSPGHAEPAMRVAGRVENTGTSSPRACPCGCETDPSPIVRCFGEQLAGLKMFGGRR